MQVSVRELKAHLSKYLHLVKTRGESVIVTSRDTARWLVDQAVEFIDAMQKAFG